MSTYIGVLLCNCVILHKNTTYVASLVCLQDHDIYTQKSFHNPTEVCNILNEYFIKAASNIGNENPISENESIDDILSCYTDDHQAYHQ